MKTNGKWWQAHVNCRKAKITHTSEEAVQEMRRVAEAREKWGCPAEAYKIISREVGEWADA